MSFYYYTIVTTIPAFYEDTLFTRLSNDDRYILERTPNGEVNIISNNAPAVSEIITLSNQFPNVIYRIKTATEDVHDNYVRLYECKNGNLTILSEGFEYIFSIDRIDRDKLPAGVYHNFCRKVAEYFNRIASDEIAFNLNFEDCKKQEPNISMILYHKTKEYILKVEKHGKTYLPVTAEFFNEPLKQTPKASSEPEYEDLPF